MESVVPSRHHSINCTRAFAFNSMPLNPNYDPHNLTFTIPENVLFLSHGDLRFYWFFYADSRWVGAPPIRIPKSQLTK